MLAYCLANKFLIFVKSCFCYLLCDRYTFFRILLKLRVEYNLKIFVNQYLIKFLTFLFIN